MRINLKNRSFIVYQAFKNGIPTSVIADKFFCSEYNIRKIIFLYRHNNHFNDIEEINTIGKALGLNSLELNHIQKILNKYGYSGNDDGWQDLLPEDLYEIPNLDPWHADIIWLAQHINA